MKTPWKFNTQTCTSRNPYIRLGFFRFLE